MRRAFLAFLALGLGVSLLPLSGAVRAQSAVQTPVVRKKLTRRLPGTLSDMGLRPRFRQLNNALKPAGSVRTTAFSASAARRQSMGPHGDGIFSIPHFNSSFTYQGQTFPYTMVGNAPNRRGTSVETEIIPIRFFLPFVDAGGNQILLDGSSKVANTLASPVFTRSPFDTGLNQFGNAMQRTTFWNAMGPDKGWFVHLDHRVRPTIDIEVPPESVQAFDLGGGAVLALISADFFVSQLNTIFEVGHFDADALPIFLTYNSLLYVGDPNNCCILGFHGAFEEARAARRGKAGQHEDHHQGPPNQVVQTYAWADWNDPGIFGPAPFDVNIADVHALSHEIAEWLNDPFTNNLVPFFQNGETGCDNLLETGDQLVGNSVPVDLNGFTYHPQTEDVLQFFSRESPSSALNGTYIFPEDPNVPNVFSAACTE